MCRRCRIPCETTWQRRTRARMAARRAVRRLREDVGSFWAVVGEEGVGGSATGPVYGYLLVWMLRMTA